MLPTFPSQQYETGISTSDLQPSNALFEPSPAKSSGNLDSNSLPHQRMAKGLTSTVLSSELGEGSDHESTGQATSVLMQALSFHVNPTSRNVDPLSSIPPIHAPKHMQFSSRSQLQDIQPKLFMFQSRCFPFVSRRLVAILRYSQTNTTLPIGGKEKRCLPPEVRIPFPARTCSN
jgi:hypothetical protein